MLKGVPLYLRRGDPISMGWLADESNVEDLKEFLSIHDIDIDLVAEIRFSNQNFKPLVYELDDEGEKILSEDGFSARAVEKTINYLTEKPTWA